MIRAMFYSFIVALGALPAVGMPPGGQFVIQDPELEGVQRNGDPRWGTVRVAKARGTSAATLTITTRERPPQRYNLQGRLTTTAPIKRGDVLLLQFEGRATKPLAGKDRAEIGVSVQQNHPPYQSVYGGLVKISSKWQLYQFPFRANASLPAGQAQLCFQAGGDPQQVQLRKISLVNYGPEMKPQQLPMTRVTYDGRDPDAAWRGAARERIEEIRKGDLRVIVQDGQGNPVPGASVSVAMQRHAFGWGSAVSAELLMADTPAAAKYRAFIKQNYNRVVFENDLKWPQWERPSRQQVTLKAIEWLQANRIDIRGHCLVWPSWKRMPRGVAQLADQPMELRARIANHIRDELKTLRGKLIEFDVINEPYSNHDVMDILGDEVMVEWFQIAHQTDPQVRLFINDYGILSRGGEDHAHQDHYEKTIRYLLAHGAPLHGIGLQSHFREDLTPPDKLWTILQRFARFDLPLVITEHDIDTIDEQLQADYTRDFLTMVFSHPSVKGVLSWGFWEGRHWRPNGAYVRQDWTLKPAGQVWQDLVRRQWWTNEQGKTGASGQYDVRGFLGEYKITVKANGKTKTVEAKLGNEGSRVVVQLPQ